MNSVPSSAASKTSTSACCRYGGFFEYDNKKERLEEVSRELEDPAVWQQPEKAQELGKQRARLSSELEEIDKTQRAVGAARLGYSRWGCGNGSGRSFD